MLPLAWVAVLIAGGAVKPGQSRFILGKMSGHPVHNNTDPSCVTGIHEPHKALGRAITGCRRKIACHLIAPGGVVGIFRQRHQLNVRIAQLLDIGNQLLSQLFIGIRVAVRIFAPGARMQLINIHRLSIMGLSLFGALPGLILPNIAVHLIVKGGVARARFVVIGIRV